MDKIGIENDSGDRKYFTIVPNYILNHSSANDQSLYMHMKRYAGENGVCYASGKTIRKKMGIGKVTYNHSIKYLLEHGWITQKGFHAVETKGGQQLVKVYAVNDIWKLNNDFYQGGSKSAHLKQRGVQNGLKGGSEMAPKKNPYKEEDISFEERGKIEESKEKIRQQMRIKK